MAIASETLLLYGGQDIAQARHWVVQSAAPETQKRVMRHQLEEMIALTEGVTCRTRSLLACFGEDLPEPCGHCDNCAAPPRTVDATVEAQKVLSAVYRTDQVFGAIHIISVLRGETTDGGAAPSPRQAADVRCRRGSSGDLLARR